MLTNIKDSKLDTAFAKEFDEICAMCRIYERSNRALPTSSLQARETIGALKRLAKLIDSDLLTEKLRARLRTSVSRGAAYFPRVPWVAIVPIGTKVSNSPSIAVCFGRAGNGAVAGLMVNASGMSKLVTVKPPRGTVWTINVKRANNSASNYGDKFVNPLEIHAGSRNRREFMSHLRKSLALFGYE